MTGKAILAAFAAGAICAGNFSAAGLGVAAKNIDVASVESSNYYNLILSYFFRSS